MVKEGENAPVYYYGLFSLNDKKTSLQTGDLVVFQLIECRNGSQKAFNINVVQSSQEPNSSQSSQQQQQQQAAGGKKREPLKGRIDSMKGHVRNFQLPSFIIWPKFETTILDSYHQYIINLISRI